MKRMIIIALWAVACTVLVTSSQQKSASSRSPGEEPPSLFGRGAGIHVRQVAAGEGSTEGPIAAAGPDLQGSQGDLVRPPRVRLAPARSLLRKPAGSLAGLHHPEGVRAGLRFDRPGDHVVRSRVEEPPGGSAARLVISTGNAAPVTTADVSRSVVPGALVVLDGSGSTDAEAASSARPPVRGVTPRRGPSGR